MQFVFEGFVVDVERFELRKRGSSVDIRRKTFDLLVYLLRNRDRVVPKEDLLAAVWDKQFASESAIPTCMTDLRQTLGDDPAKQRLIRTVRGRGYQFVASVREEASSDHSFGPGDQQPRFIGRERELAALRQALATAASGSGRVVLLGGEPGVGKTRTLEEFALRAAGEGADVVLGRCHEVDGAPSFWPWMQVVRGLVAHESDGDPDLESIEPSAQTLAQLIPELRAEQQERGSPASPAEARFRLLQGMTRFLQKAAEARPLVLILDDVHRADPASLLMLRFLTRELFPARVLIVTSFRDLELARDASRREVFGEIARSDASIPLELRGLSLSEVGEFVTEAECERGRVDELAEAFYERTAGNPFFLSQLVALLDAEVSESKWDDFLKGEMPLPVSVREAVRQHVTGLPEQTQILLTAAAVMGREFSSAILGVVSGLEREAVLETLAPALDARILMPVPVVGHFSFAHVLLRDALYEDLNTVRRVALHKRIARALEKAHGSAPGQHTSQLAHHYFEAASAGEARKAVHYAVVAGQWATDHLAYEDAVSHYENATQLLDLSEFVEDEERCELLLMLGEAQLRANDRPGAQATFKSAVDLARETGNAEQLARAALGYAPAFLAIEVGVADEYLIGILEESLEALGSEDSALRAMVTSRLAIALYWTRQERRRATLADEGVGVARRAGDDRALGYAIAAREGALWTPENPGVRAELAAAATALAVQSGDREMELVYRLYRLTSLFQAGDFAAADLEIDAYSGQANELLQPHSLWYQEMFTAGRAFVRGDVELAARLSDSFFERGKKVHDVNAAHCHSIYQALYAVEVGSPQDSVSIYRRLFATYRLDVFECAIAWSACSIDRIDEGREAFSNVIERGIASIQTDVVWLAAMAMLSETSCMLKDRDAADELYRLLIPHEDEYVVVGYSVVVYSPVRRFLGALCAALQRFDEAEQHFVKAIEMSESAGAPGWIAHCQYWYARMLLDRSGAGDRSRALELIATSTAGAEKLGMKPLLGRLGQLAAEAG